MSEITTADGRFLLKSVLEDTDTNVPISSSKIALKQKVPCAEESIIIPESIPAIAEVKGEWFIENATSNGIKMVVPAPKNLKLK